jgi:hypothetical protein
MLFDEVIKAVTILKNTPFPGIRKPQFLGVFETRNLGS